MSRAPGSESCSLQAKKKKKRKMEPIGQNESRVYVNLGTGG